MTNPITTTARRTITATLIAATFATSLAGTAQAQNQNQDIWEAIIIEAIDHLLNDDDRQPEPAPPLPEPEPQTSVAIYCITGTNDRNRFRGDYLFANGFTAERIGGGSAVHYYERLGTSNRFVGPTGATYTLYRDGTASWSDGQRVAPLHRCD